MAMVVRRAPTTDELWQIIQEQREDIAALRHEVATSTASGKPAREPSRRRRAEGKRLSRSGLLKIAADGVAGMAGAELAGSLGAAPVLAATDSNFDATGGATNGFSNSGSYGTV